MLRILWKLLTIDASEFLIPQPVERETEQEKSARAFARSLALTTQDLLNQ